MNPTGSDFQGPLVAREAARAQPRFPGVSRLEKYPSGVLRSLFLSEETIVDTPLGPLTPQFRYDEPRKKYAPALKFYPSGALKCLRLENITPVESPAGVLPAEELVFYESGALKRLFPVNGKLSGYWSEKDEKALNSRINLTLPKFGDFSLYLSGLSFHEGGEIKSLTLWPNED
ncbi:MAG: hypothetical protein LBF41_00190, partial [Deltaproteobacteria bacterium]|nr:hypothetical protein [Deltaproteobacteria bacterium]